ncbi:hypothetical protein Dcar01_00664 [Deinococcus carri]|uniref:Uncharacterized protein n=1 Tax=Deinococcus carri TaxID=1211323 RepID=A0ABP9W3L1_9DEIO
MDFQTQVEHEGFPAGAQVTTAGEPTGRVFRVTQGEGALEILLTDDAVKIYGEGPTRAMVLQRLREAAEAGLPPREAGGGCVRQVFLGD